MDPMDPAGPNRDHPMSPRVAMVCPGTQETLLNDSRLHASIASSVDSGRNTTKLCKNLQESTDSLAILGSRVLSGVLMPRGRRLLRRVRTGLGR